jgi:VanZ family protein
VTSTWPGRRTYLLCALAAIAFIFYGSLVPFGFEPMSWSSAVAEFARARVQGFVIGSRTDLAANVLVFVPVGYFLMAWLRTDRVRLAGDLIVGAGVIVTCIALSVAVEFAQTFFPPRLPSFTDIGAESIGGALGAVLWLVVGRTVTAWLRDLAPRRGGPVVVHAILLVYVLGLVLAELMPLDVTVDLGELAQKVREGRIVLRPFAFGVAGGALAWHIVSTMALWMPVGAAALLVGQRGDRRRPPMVAIAMGTLVAGLVELAQVFVVSRFAEVSDVMVAAAGVAAGVAITLVLWRRQLVDRAKPDDGRTQRLAFGGLLAWMAALAAYHWMPFNFSLDSEQVKTGLGHLFSAPMSGYYFGTEFNAVTQILRKTLLALPLGALLALAAPAAADANRRALQTTLLVLAGIAVLGVIEVGQVFLPSRYPDFADVIIGGAGVLAGFWLVRRTIGPRAPATDVLPASRSR